MSFGSMTVLSSVMTTFASPASRETVMSVGCQAPLQHLLHHDVGGAGESCEEDASDAPAACSTAPFWTAGSLRPTFGETAVITLGRIEEQLLHGLGLATK